MLTNYPILKDCTPVSKTKPRTFLQKTLLIFNNYSLIDSGLDITTNTGYTASPSEGTSGTTWTIPNVTSSHQAIITFSKISSGEPLEWTKRYDVLVAAGVQKVFVATVDAKKTGFTVEIYGITNTTDATFTWTFPDGRTFPPPGEPWIYGIGTSGGRLGIYGTSTGWQANILDQYIPEGQHILTIRATDSSSLVMTVN